MNNHTTPVPGCEGCALALRAGFKDACHAHCLEAERDRYRAVLREVWVQGVCAGELKDRVAEVLELKTVWCFVHATYDECELAEEHKWK